MKLKTLYLGAGILMLFGAILFDINFLNYHKPIPYSKWETISFYDFVGVKSPFHKLEGSNKFAFIKTSRQIHYLASETVEIITIFHPSRSYVFAEDIRDNALLRHELYHFHIAEYYTRLLRQEIAEDRIPMTKSRIASLCKKYDKLENELQAKYDDESYHSYVLQEQKKWEMLIDQQLAALKGFSQSVVHFKTVE
jgi:hypothetical protein